MCGIRNVLRSLSLSAALGAALTLVLVSGQAIGEDAARDGARATAAYEAQAPASAVARAPVPVVFRFQDPAATVTNLAGDFNGWCFVGGDFDTSVDPMSGPDQDGWWTLEKPLDPGYWEYKFVTDGYVWHTDPLNPRSNPDDHNNSILTVSDPLVYYLSPLDATTTGQPRPEISAYLAKSSAQSFDLDELGVYVDDVLVASGGGWFDASTKLVSYTPDVDLANGEHEAKVRIALMSGASHSDSCMFRVSADPVPPTIMHTPVSGVAANAAVTIECTITDDVGVESASLFYGNEGDAGFNEAPMFGGLDDTWAGIVPAGFTESGADLEYYFEASDLTNTTRSPAVGEYAVPVTSDDQAPVISQAFASPSTFDPNGEDEACRRHRPGQITWRRAHHHASRHAAAARGLQPCRVGWLRRGWRTDCGRQFPIPP
jgi:hypothetical protein